MCFINKAIIVKQVKTV